MPTIDQLKEEQTPPTPLFLFDCTLRNGSVERWGTHAVSFNGHNYDARLLKHNLFELAAAPEDSKISVTLANADSRFSEIERETGFRGAQVVVQFLFYDLTAQQAASEARIVFRGIANAAEETTETALRVAFTNRLNLQRIVLPEVRIQRRCPWVFPATSDQRLEALNGGAKGKYSALYRCGYSADQTGGAGLLDTLNGGQPFTSCDYTRPACEARGMFQLGRFGGVEFVPAQIVVRSFGEASTHLSPVVLNEARYNDFVPLVYGTAWYQPPVVVARNDGNLTHLEVLLGMGEIEAVLKVIVNDVEVPEGVSGLDMTWTGWYNLITHGARSGSFNPDFPGGDPYGSMAMVSVVVPNQISNGQTLPRVQVLLGGLKLERFDQTGASLGEAFTNNPAWVLLDVLRRSGWLTSEVDLVSFATAAAYCEEAIQTTDLYGNTVLVPRFECNLVLNRRWSAAEVARGIRNGSSLLMTYGNGGLLTLRVENTLALQQPAKPDGSNSTEALNGGWPAYEFSDGSAAFSGILRKPNGEPAIRLYAASGADTPNRLTVEFQDEFNEYQQDSLSLVDVDDALLTQREVTAVFPALGLPNFDQATRMLDLQLAKSTVGSTLIEFETTVRGVGLAPGDLITFTYLKEGLQRQPFRVTRLTPGLNYQTVVVTARWHDDGWYTSGGASAAGGRRTGAAETGLPRPLVGTVLDGNGIEQFGITETVIPLSDGGFQVKLSATFTTPLGQAASLANIPLVSLNPTLAATGGTLAGGQTLYYAVSATDSNGAESGLSFAVQAKIPTGTNTNTVSLTGLSFSAGNTAGFSVYRGSNPIQMLRIAHSHAVASSFTDAGGAAELVGPPDSNYNHANFYWRLELQPEANAGIYSATTIGKNGLGMLADNFKGALVRVMRGTGATQERIVVTNTDTTLTVTPPWLVQPDSTSYFVVADGTWKFGGLSGASPAEFEVPNMPGATVEISGRSANVHDQESAYELNPLTRWQIGGSGGGVDVDTPPQPAFALNPAGHGTVELLAIGFTTLANTHTIEAGTLGLFYWDELTSPTAYSLGTGVASTDTTVTLSPTGPAGVGDLIQIEAEILEVTGVGSGGTQYEVIRGSHGSTAAAHGAGKPLYHLRRSIMIVPFVRGFFGSPASGAFGYSVFLPDVRIGAAELFMTNAVGGGLVAKAAFGQTVDQGLRTLSGGQMSIQSQGYLAIQTSAAPPLVMEDSHVARDIFAVVREAPTGGAIVLQLRQNSSVYCTLTIADGQTISNVVNGFGLAPLATNDQLNLDITSVPTAANTLPGRDLTVTIRL
jgi:hypothetical protein